MRRLIALLALAICSPATAGTPAIPQVQHTQDPATCGPTACPTYPFCVLDEVDAPFDEANIGLSPALRGLLSDLDSPSADLRPDLATAVDAATRGRLAGDLSALLERTRNL